VGRSGGQSPIDTKQNARSPGFTRSWRKSSSMTMIDAALLLPRVSRLLYQRSSRMLSRERRSD
jgi:hypothetical protein